MATIKATKIRAESFPAKKFKKLGKTGFLTSICGFGCYRIDDSIAEHHKALKLALVNGINLIDTSANYADGGSEKLIGNVLRNSFLKGELLPDDLIIVSKGGYIQGNNLKLVQEKEEAGKSYDEVVKCSHDLWHSIHPDFLNDQITSSLERLQLKKIDIYLLHNPEYFLTYSDISSAEEKQNEYYRRIKNAFIYLEDEVKNGRISYYGISSNTFNESSDKNNFTSLERVIDIANEISEENHFAIIQLPLNPLEKNAVTLRNQQNNTKTTLELAAENDLGVLVNRPLNAIKDNYVIRLSDFTIKEDRTKEEIDILIEDIGNKEEKIIHDYVNNIAGDFEKKKNLFDSISLSKLLKDNYEKFTSPNHFLEIKGSYIIPRANHAIELLVKQFPEDDNLADILNAYAVSINIIMDSIESDLARIWNKKNLDLHEKLNKFMEPDQQKLSLSQKVILMINSLPEVSCTLVGMRSQGYVNDVMSGVKSDYIERKYEFWGMDKE